MWESIIGGIVSGAGQLLTNSDKSSTSKSSPPEQPSLGGLMPRMEETKLPTPGKRVANPFGMNMTTGKDSKDPFAMRSDMVFEDPMELTKRWIEYLDEDK